jgi:putative DNA primase/helicase
MKLAWCHTKQKFLKTPIDMTGFPANSDEMNVSFSTASQHLTGNRVLNYRHPDCSTQRLGLIDCDDCVGPDGGIKPFVKSLLKYMDTYAEFSVTNGVHLLCWLDDVPPDGHKDREWNVEFYWASRSIPITGNRVVLADWSSPDDVQPKTRKFLSLHRARFQQEWLPPAPAQTPKPSCLLCRDEILSKLFGEPAGKKWADIYAGNWHGHYESPSDADLALLMKLAFYTGKDRHMMESLFSESPLSGILVRGTIHEPVKWRTPKWATTSYRKKTLDAAITRTNNVYTPRKRALSAQEWYETVRRRVS